MKSGFQMSISIIFSLLVALFLFMSTHPCNARRLLDIKRDAEGTFHLPNELFVQEIGRSIRVRASNPSNAQNSDSKEFHKGTLNKDFPQETTIIKAQDGEHYYPRKTLTEINVHENGVNSSSSTNVSWQVPHNKKEEHQQEPGFNLDYSPPKTHPPVHN
ncbi:hypothetical protein LIER_16881 [Lithospermum erythrorhizon]|uniref:Uncharacterized protein n=1 Tax=Lithospermum erythrorhizon TaxID=34254 RepID=A0AAV3Q9P2_LITER